jgi:azurin
MKTTMTQSAWAVLLGLAWRGAMAAGACHVEISSNDAMQFDQRELHVSAACSTVEVTLHHTGKQPARVMGHDWVLSKTADMSALAIAGMAMGFDKGYVPTGDKRVIAATRIVGGGESTSTQFSTAGLETGGNYSFFCSSPGHYAVMKGRFVIDADRSAAHAGNETKAR